MVTREEAEVAKTLAEGIASFGSFETGKSESKCGSNDALVGFAFERDAVKCLSEGCKDAVNKGLLPFDSRVWKNDERNGGLEMKLDLDLGLSLSCGGGGGNEVVEGMNSVLDAASNRENVVDEVAGEEISGRLFEEKSGMRLAHEGNNVSLVEFYGPSERENKIEKQISNGDNKDSLVQNERVQNRKGIKGLSSLSMEGNNEMNGRDEEIGEDGEDTSKDNNDDEDNDDDDDTSMDDDDLGDQNHEYLVGDFVWGKIRSHPWWPGLIYDSSDASENAVKYRKRGGYLVAYFGDGTFSWCLGSKLKPFVENFDKMSVQSNSRNFVNAVQDSLDEFGRRVELDMTCLCIPKENMITLNRQLTVNAGIKEGTLIAEGDTERFMIPGYEPANVLADTRYMAQVVSVSSTLKLSVLKGWLSAFYFAKGNHSLVFYHDHGYIQGLEDKNRSAKIDTNDFSIPIKVPIQGPFEEDWLGSDCEKFSAVSEDKPSHKRKQKSVAELMKDDATKARMGGKGTVSDRSMSEKKKEKGREDARNLSVNTSTHSGKKRPSESPNARSSVTPNAEITRGLKAATSDFSSSRRQETTTVSSSENGGGIMKVDLLDNPSSPRERKRSKYLSPPYTSSQGKARNSIPKDLEIKTKTESAIKTMEQTTEVVDKLLESHPISNACNENSSEELTDRHDEHCSQSLVPQETELDAQAIGNDLQINPGLKVSEVLLEVQSVAISPLNMGERSLPDEMGEFIFAFKRATHGRKPTLSNKYTSGRKRKLSTPEPSKLQIDLNQIDGAPVPVPWLAGAEKKKKLKTDRKLKQAARAFLMKENATDGEQDNNSTDTLIVQFSVESSLPSKAHLIDIYEKFGALNLKETKVDSNTGCAHVVFQKSCDAEAAFKFSMEKNPFGAINVDYRLQSSSTSLAPSSIEEETPVNVISSQLTDSGVVSHVGFIRQKLGMLISMLENCNDVVSPEMKSTLEEEVETLLEKIRSLA